ncbi:phospholipid/cholesterol/gamma-HCH transport system substrate-binding protein [Crossiella equi]|uniref:Phospholipid/cholesterol/gamma-HCH transport system substrate-binding protein n=1 Tax=Crossiella equi TaxID=130796 RepID=A0ABS5AHR6_9PSEU|nr:MCE family protein [Crossiella equi]MBP2476119.1 phospholipid/cholesterol/gamma-HCH transport system substrate-binding protein [Crossiella equi]
MKRALRLTGLVLCASLLSGCGLGEFGGLYNVPLPGGADLGEHPYRVKVRFKDVLDLVPQAGVKVNDVAVGKVESVALAPDGWTAEVTVLVNGGVKLPANADAKLRQSSLLGEKFVELAAPRNAQGSLADGALIPIERTNRNPEVEEVFGALSLLLNGGGVAQLQTITKELNKALSGREPELRELLSNVDKLVSTLDGHKTEITRALDGLNRLSATLVGQLGNIRTALDGLEPGLKVLAEQRQQLVGMLTALDRLSGVATDVVNRSKDDLVHDLKALTPTLQKLGEAGQNLPKGFELLLTFPFPDSAVDGIKGDYTNLHAKIDLDLSRILDNLGSSRQPLLPLPGGTPQQGAAPPLLPGLPSLPGVGGGQQQGGGGGLGDLLTGLLGGGRR